jgi:hypothetical protein
MAETPQPFLTFAPGCPDCGERAVDLPGPLPAPGDDFDWLARDYDGLRRFMMEELAARFPERRQWKPADMEVVLVETLAVVLDQLNDMLDRVSAEAFLESARRPQSVRRLLAMIGYDAVRLARLERMEDLEALARAFPRVEIAVAAARAAGEDPLKAVRLADPAELETYWLRQPRQMEAARAAGPRAIRTQHRMVTPADYAARLMEHPLVSRAHAWTERGGSWTLLRIAARPVHDLMLDQRLSAAGLPLPVFQALTGEVVAFHEDRGLRLPPLAADPTPRTVLRPFVDAYRMAGQEVWMGDGEPVGIDLSMTVRIAPNYFQSEVRRSLRAALGTGLGGFFEPGRLGFGEDLHASDLIAVAMALEGVEAVCLNRFKRVGKAYPNEAGRGLIRLDGLEYAVCGEDRADPSRGFLDLKFHGGKQG